MLSVLAVWQVAQPNGTVWGSTIAHFLVPFFSLSVGLNISMTLAIVSRLLYLRKRVATALGPSHATPYTSIASMFIESGALYSSLGLIYIVSRAVGSNVQNLVLQSLNQAAVCPICIIRSVDPAEYVTLPRSAFLRS